VIVDHNELGFRGRGHFVAARAEDARLGKPAKIEFARSRAISSPRA
jgi:hypothetical protein